MNANIRAPFAECISPFLNVGSNASPVMGELAGNRTTEVARTSQRRRAILPGRRVDCLDRTEIRIPEKSARNSGVPIPLATDAMSAQSLDLHSLHRYRTCARWRSEQMYRKFAVWVSPVH